MRIHVLFFFISVIKITNAQFAPAVGKPGSTALKHDSTCFVAWATGCNVVRGYRDVSRPDSGYADAGTAQAAIGPALQNGIVSLGDGGTATLTFSNPITNGPGWDFAVFENSFLDTFLEMAFVELSSDGKRFVRFPAISLTDTTLQTGTFGYTFPEKINNLAGKYRVGFGTPFDLEELTDSSGIDIASITHIRIKDVTGSLLPAFASRDSKGNKINDPWPTRFSSGGFDLDAVGVIHEKLSIQKNKSNLNSSIKLGPNPLYGCFLNVYITGQALASLYDISGSKIVSWNIQTGLNTLKIDQPTGMYFLFFSNNHGTSSHHIEIIR